MCVCVCVCVTNYHGICSICLNHNLVFSSSMTFHRVCYKRTITGVTIEAGTPNPPGTPKFNPGI